MESHPFLAEPLIAYDPTGIALTRPSGTLSRPTGEGWGEGRFMGSDPEPGRARLLPSRIEVGQAAARREPRPTDTDGCLEDSPFLVEVFIALVPKGLTLTRPCAHAGTLSRPTGDGWGEAGFRGRS
jgi:hypothetical protein